MDYKEIKTKWNFDKAKWCDPDYGKWLKKLFQLEKLKEKPEVTE